MTNPDVLCPNCGAMVSYSVQAYFDDEEVILHSVHYTMTCVKCQHTFVSEKRIGRHVIPTTEAS